jgi:hypothetical protein
MFNSITQQQKIFSGGGVDISYQRPVPLLRTLALRPGRLRCGLRFGGWRSFMRGLWRGLARGWSGADLVRGKAHALPIVLPEGEVPALR